MIELVNRKFVCTWIIVDEAAKLAAEGNALGKVCHENWEFPLDLMFLSPDGTLLSKLNSFNDLRGAHPDVGHPPEERGKDPAHIEVFLNHVEKHFAAR